MSAHRPLFRPCSGSFRQEGRTSLTSQAGGLFTLTKFRFDFLPPALTHHQVKGKKADPAHPYTAHYRHLATLSDTSKPAELSERKPNPYCSKWEGQPELIIRAKEWDMLQCGTGEPIYHSQTLSVTVPTDQHRHYRRAPPPARKAFVRSDSLNGGLRLGIARDPETPVEDDDSQEDVETVLREWWRANDPARHLKPEPGLEQREHRESTIKQEEREEREEIQEREPESQSMLLVPSSTEELQNAQSHQAKPAQHPTMDRWADPMLVFRYLTDTNATQHDTIDWAFTPAGGKQGKAKEARRLLDAIGVFGLDVVSLSDTAKNPEQNGYGGNDSLDDWWFAVGDAAECPVAGDVEPRQERQAAQNLTKTPLPILQEDARGTVNKVPDDDRGDAGSDGAMSWESSPERPILKRKRQDDDERESSRQDREISQELRVEEPAPEIMSSPVVHVSDSYHAALAAILQSAQEPAPEPIYDLSVVGGRAQAVAVEPPRPIEAPAPVAEPIASSLTVPAPYKFSSSRRRPTTVRAGRQVFDLASSPASERSSQASPSFDRLSQPVGPPELPLAPTPIAPTPVAPTPVAPPTIAPTPIAPTPIVIASATDSSGRSTKPAVYARTSAMTPIAATQSVVPSSHEIVPSQKSSPIKRKAAATPRAQPSAQPPPKRQRTRLDLPPGAMGLSYLQVDNIMIPS